MSFKTIEETVQVTSVSRILEIRDTKTTSKANRKQSLFVKTPGYHNADKSIKYPEDVYEIQLWNDAIERFNLLQLNLHGKMIKIEVYVRGRTFLNNGELEYKHILTLKSLKTI